jgi:hypothetical protein
MVQEYSRHHWDSSPVNDHQCDLDIRDDPCVSTKVFLLLNRKFRCPIPFVSAILAISKTRLSVSSYLVQSHYQYFNSLILWYSIPVTYSHVATLDEISPSGPRVSVHHTKEQIPLLIHMPLHTPLETQKTPFQSPCNHVMVDAIKASSWSSD